jgi:hypothetical protein
MTQRALTVAASRYARTWIELEKGLASDIGALDRAIRLAALQRCASYFRIARNFPTRFDVDKGIPRLEPVLAIVDTLTARLRADRLLDTVDLTSQRLARAYGKKGLLSASTKLLWLIHRDPVIIYDSQVRASLGVPAGDYPSYVKRWHDMYAQHALGIRSAASSIRIPGVPLDREWFRRRVFDVYLWTEGAPVRLRSPGGG